MASKSFTAIALFLAVNLLMFNLAAAQTCTAGTAAIRACATVLDLADPNFGRTNTPVVPCCSLINGLASLNAAACICQSLKATVLGIANSSFNVDGLLRFCGLKPPTGFTCA